MGKAIAIFNQKGGVGKTTTNINLGASLALLGLKVLIVDIDPQGNTTSGIGVSKRALSDTVYELLIQDNYNPKKAILKTGIKGLDVIPANVDLAGAEIELVALDGRETRLKKSMLSAQDGSAGDLPGPETCQYYMPQLWPAVSHRFWNCNCRSSEGKGTGRYAGVCCAGTDA